MNATIYHNPKCSKSRATLALLEESGITPTVILYLKNPPNIKELTDMLASMNLSARDLLRSKGAVYDELGLDDDSLSEQHLIDTMVKNPELIDRPVVVTEQGVRLCRPPETVLEIIS
ncbi:MAG: arsenate reductase (glutaredoxin) [Granulosicoccus sp.]